MEKCRKGFTRSIYFDHLEALLNLRRQAKGLFMLSGLDGHQAAFANSPEEPLLRSW